ncbi:MAG: S-layer protein [Candidatus Micrarchaeota archaeon]|nr:S-layer protein [Candidatus Micrarchaeota archaeon]
MQLRKVSAVVGSALMAGLTLAGAAMAATTVGTIGDLAKPTDSTAKFPLIVIGSETTNPEVSTSDVAAAVNVALYLAAHSKVTKAVEGTTTAAIDGVQKEASIGETSLRNVITSDLTNVHASFLKDSSITVGTDKKGYYETIIVPSASVSNSYSTFNGTVGVDLTGASTKLEYRLVFREDVNLTEGGYGTDNPLTLEILGKTFNIIKIDSNSFTAQIGERVTLTLNEPQTVGDYQYEVTNGGSDWVSISVKDSAGNTVDSFSLSTSGTTERIVSGTGVKVKLLAVRASQITGTVEADLLIGEQTEQTFQDGDSFPGNEDWKFNLKLNGGNQANANDYIGVEYSPALPDKKKLKPGEKITAPNDYFSLMHNGFTVNKYATLTVKPISGVTIYDSNDKAISDLSGVYGIEITSDEKVFNGAYYTAVVVFKNQTNGLNATIAYKNPVKSNHLIMDSSVLVENYTASATASGVSIKVTYGSSTYYVKLPADSDGTTENYQPNVTIEGYDQNVTARFRFDSSNRYSAPLKLGANAGSAEAADVSHTNDGDIGTRENDWVYDKHGTIIAAPEENAKNDQVVIKMPAETVKVKVAIGRAGGEVTTTGGTTEKVVPITTDVVKLDTEVREADKKNNDLILVGGPCVNALVAELASAGKFPYTCESWPAEDFGMVKVIEDAFTEGKVAVVVAGTRAPQTDLAARALQAGELEKEGVRDKTEVRIRGESLETMTIE